jgi:predicted phosphohydrolase
MKIHLVSDLHLAFGDYQLPGGADLLIIAGDTIEAKALKSAKRFFDEEVTKYPRAILIMGNHEFYGMDMQDAKNAIRAVLPANCVFLDNDCFEYNGWTFVGSTMWTDCNGADPLTMYSLKYGMNDYSSIKFTKEPFVRFSPEHSYYLHKRAIKFIDTASKVSNHVFVVSHHAPTFASIHPLYANDKALNGGYASDLSNLILDNPNIKYWVHGHTHHRQDYQVGDCRVLCNPRGYVGYEACANGYEPLEFEIA